MGIKLFKSTAVESANKVGSAKINKVRTQRKTQDYCRGDYGQMFDPKKSRKR